MTGVPEVRACCAQSGVTGLVDVLLNTTVPEFGIAVPEPEPPAEIFAVKVTGWLTVDGLGAEASVVLLDAEPTTWIVEPGVPARKFESPEKVAVTEVPGDAIALVKV